MRGRARGAGAAGWRAQRERAGRRGGARVRRGARALRAAARSLRPAPRGRRGQPPLELAEHGSEQEMPPGGLRERAARTTQRRKLVAGGMEAIGQRGRRPTREVLGERRCRAARPRRQAAGARLQVGVDGPEGGAVEEVHRRAGGTPARTAGDRLAEQFDVVEREGEHALVDRLLGGPDRGGGRAGQRTADRAGSARRAARRARRLGVCGHDGRSPCRFA